MAGQKKVNSNVEVKKEVVETKPAPVETKPVATPAKKGGKAAKADNIPPTPVVAVPVTPVPAKKGGKAAKADTTTPSPVVAEPVPPKKGGKSAPVVAAPVAPVKKSGKAAKADTTTPAPVAATPKKGGKVPKETPVKKAKVPKKVVDEDSQDEESGDGKKHVRSFKVRLPGSEAFEGRFTGLTPYQAANKALSKYYRESNELQKEVTFSICESTRNSRKCTYTYVGGRHELSTPVTYTIADGRLITKKYKNVLKKVKKTEEVASN
jgi:hypothetical protein